MNTGVQQPQRQKLYAPRWFLVLLVALGICFIGGVVVQVSAPKETVSTNTLQKMTGDEPPEQLLGAIEARHYVSMQETNVVRFGFLLDRIQQYTHNDRHRIADLTVNAQTILREKYGKEISLMTLMEAANKSVGPGYPNTDYADLMALEVGVLGP